MDVQLQFLYINQDVTSAFNQLLESLRNDNRVTKVETWEGLLEGEYINIHTGKIEKIYGF